MYFSQSLSLSFVINKFRGLFLAALVIVDVFIVWSVECREALDWMFLFLYPPSFNSPVINDPDGENWGWWATDRAVKEFWWRV